MSHFQALLSQALSGIKDKKFVFGTVFGVAISALPSLKYANDAEDETFLARTEASLCKDELSDAQEAYTASISKCDSDKALILFTF